MNSENYFKKALQDFTFSAACGDAICHLADKGMTVNEIAKNLTYPASKEMIGKCVWEHFVQTGRISLEDPKEAAPVSYEFVKEYTSTGRATFRRVEKKSSVVEREYYLCDFGKRRYQDAEAFEEMLELLEPGDQDYVRGLPWSIKPVYHVADERMSRIMRIIG